MSNSQASISILTPPSDETASTQISVSGLAWRAVQPPLLVVGPVGPEHLDAATELGLTLAAMLGEGLL